MKSTLALLGMLAIGSWAQAAVLYNADNEGFALGSTPPTSGPPTAPTTIDPNLGLTVQDGTTVAAPNLGPDQFLRLTESAGEAPDFRYDIGTSLTSGIVTVRMDLLFENLEDYHVYFRESATSAVSVANILFRPLGVVEVESKGGTSIGAYTAGTSYVLEARLDLNAEVMDVLLNGTPIATSQSIDDVFGAALIGFEFTSFTPQPTGFDGVMQVDNFVVTAVPEPGTLAMLALGFLAFGARRGKRA